MSILKQDLNDRISFTYFSWRQMVRKRIFQNVTIRCGQRNDAEASSEFKHQLLELNFFLTTKLDLIDVPSC